jgi:hypothetical protein
MTQTIQDYKHYFQLKKNNRIVSLHQTLDSRSGSNRIDLQQIEKVWIESDTIIIQYKGRELKIVYDRYEIQLDHNDQLIYLDIYF